MPRAQWSLLVRKRSTDADTGVATLHAELMDNNVKNSDITITISPTRSLRLEVVPAQGVEPFAGFEAWMVGDLNIVARSEA